MLDVLYVRNFIVRKRPDKLKFKRVECVAENVSPLLFLLSLYVIELQ